MLLSCTAVAVAKFTGKGEADEAFNVTENTT